MNLYSPEHVPFEKVDKVGIAITAQRAPGHHQFHVAILFQDQETSKLLHLPSNHVALGNPKPKYMWLELGEEFSDIDKTVLQAHIQKVINANGIPFGVSYGFDVNGKLFDPETGRFTPHSEHIGMTCATFILEVFASCGFTLIDYDSWPKPTKVDERWQKSILETFYAQGAMPRQTFEIQIKNVGNKRFLPEEVAASTQFEIPVVRGKLKQAADEVSRAVKQHIKSLE